MDEIVPVRLILIGDSSVGKTSLLKRFAKGTYSLEKSDIDYAVEWVMVQVDNMTVQLQIHDTAGQERYKAITRNYYRNVDAILLVYDVTRMETFTALTGWLDEIKLYCEEDVPIVTVGNKTDDEAKKAVTIRTVLSHARQSGHVCMETSAAQNINVENVFFTALSLVLKKKNLLSVDSEAKMDIITQQLSTADLPSLPHEPQSLPPRLDQKIRDNISKKLFSKRSSDTVQLHESSTQTEQPEKRGCC